MKRIAIPALVLTTVLGGIATPVVYGQAVTSDAVQAQGQPQTDRAQTDQQRRHRLPSDRIEARLAYLKTALKITPAQETQWTALANVLRRQSRERDTLIEQRRAQHDAQRPPASAIEQLQRRQQLLAEEASRLSDLVIAARPLYASFSDDQKKTADEMLGHRGHRFGRSWH